MLPSSTPADRLPAVPPIADFDVRHASPPRRDSRDPAADPALQTPVEKPKTWQIKGPLSSYALNVDRIEMDFLKERERLRTDLGKAFALKARYVWLLRLIDSLSEERLPEIDAEWNAVRALKTQLQASQNTSNLCSIESDARNLLPVWQSPLKVPEALKTKFNRVQRVMEVQKLLNAASARLLDEFQQIEQDKNILNAKLSEIEALERTISGKITALMASPYTLNDIVSLKTECSFDKLRYPLADAPLQYIKDKFLDAEKIWREAKAKTGLVREKLQEWASIKISEANASLAPVTREVEVMASFERARVQQKDLQCSQFSEKEFQEKVAFLARFGVVPPEINLWINQAQEELEKRLALAQQDLETLKTILADFEKELLGYREKGKPSPALVPEPVLIESLPKPGLLDRLASLVPGKAKPKAGLQVAPTAIDWSKIVPVQPRLCTSAVLPIDRNERIRPPEGMRRNLADVPEESWTQTDRWDRCLVGIWPRAINLLNQSLSQLNSAIARLEMQFFDLQQAYRSEGHRRWLEADYWKLRDESRNHTMLRSTFERVYDQYQTELRAVVVMLEDALAKRPAASASEGPLDVQLINMQQKMEEAFQDLKLLGELLKVEWQYGQRAQNIKENLESLEVLYSPGGRKNAPSLPSGELHASAGRSPDKRRIARTTFNKICETKSLAERRVLLAAMASENYVEEKKKLMGHEAAISQHAEQLDRLLQQLVMIYANWQHLRNVVEGIACAKPYLSESTIKVYVMQLLVAFNNVKKDVVSYIPLLPELTKRLEEKALWLEEKLPQDRVEWRALQEKYLLRTPEGNRERNEQIALEIAKYRLGVKAINLYWTLGQQSCQKAMDGINNLLTKGDDPVKMISESPYKMKVESPASPILRPASAPATTSAKPPAPHREWILLEEDEEHKLLSFSEQGVFGKPAAAAPEHNILTSSDFDRLQHQAEALGALAGGASNPEPHSTLSASPPRSSDAPISAALDGALFDAGKPASLEKRSASPSASSDASVPSASDGFLTSGRTTQPASIEDLSASLLVSSDAPTPVASEGSSSSVVQQED